MPYPISEIVLEDSPRPAEKVAGESTHSTAVMVNRNDAFLLDRRVAAGQDYFAPANVRAKRHIEKIAALVSIACVLQIFESLIPQPVPGVRVGLANIITMITLLDLGFKSALEVAVIRTIVSSLILGTFMTPTFIMSFSGAIISTLVMGVFTAISSLSPQYGFSIIGISILGAIAHNITQLSVAYFMLIKHTSIFYFLPILMVSAVIMGWITGFVSSQVFRKLMKSRLVNPKAIEAQTDLAHNQTSGQPSPNTEVRQGNSFLHQLSPEWQILSMILLCGLIIFLRSFRAYLILAAGLAALMFVTRLPWDAYGKALARVRSLGSFIVISFSFPILFSSAGSGDTLAKLGPLNISEQALAAGSLFAIRIILLLWVSYLFSVFATPAGIACGLQKLLAPFGFLGLPVNRISQVISLALAALPNFRERVRANIRLRENMLSASGRKEKGLKRMRNIVSIISDIIVSTYRQSECQDIPTAMSRSVNLTSENSVRGITINESRRDN